MTQLIHQPNDKFFKQAMADSRVAKEFFTQHLPSALLAHMDLASLSLTPHSFIDEAYKATEADVIYRMMLDGQPAYIYLLVEHQSSIDNMMAFRLWVYTVRLMELHHKQYPDKPLPVVYSLVVYTGQKSWDAPHDIFGLFGEQAEIAKDYLLKPYQLIEVQRLDDDVLRMQRWSGVVEFVLKYREVRDLAQFLETLLPWLSELEQHAGVTLAKNVLYYVIEGIEADNTTLLLEKAQQHLSTTLQEDMMTLAQQFELQGKARGIAEGLVKGKLEGKLEGQAQLLIRLMKRKFGDVPAGYLHRIEHADADMLAIWSEQLLDVDAIEAVFK